MELDERFQKSAAAAYRKWRVEKGDAPLAAVVERLRHLVGLLQRDSTCTWTPAFASVLTRALALQLSPFTQSDLIELAHSISVLYRGVCSFDDYTPYDRGSIAAWTEEFDHARRELLTRLVDLCEEID